MRVVSGAPSGLPDAKCGPSPDLVVSPLTVRTHVHRAMTKLGARDRAQLVVVAYRTGLVQAPPPPTGGSRRLVGHSAVQAKPGRRPRAAARRRPQLNP